MKLYTMDKTEILDVSKITTNKEGLVVEGTVMGTMPLRTVLRAQEMRAGLRLLGWGTMWRALKMLVTGKA